MKNAVGFHPLGLTVSPALPAPAGAGTALTAQTYAAPGALSALDYGVKADGHTDDAPAAQAAVAAALAGTRARLLLPPGPVPLSSPLAVTGTAGQQASGLSLQGAGLSASNGPLAGGTTLTMTGANQDSVIRVGAGFFIGQSFSDFSLRGHGQDNSPRDTRIGLHWAETQWTQATCTNLSVAHVGTAFQQDYGSGNADGEALALIQCRAVDVDCFLRNTANQAYGNTVVGGGATVNDHGIVFDFPGQGGCDFGVYGFLCSFPTAQVDNVLVNATAMEGPGQIHDIRAEKVGTVFKCGAGSPNVCGQVVIDTAAFPGMPDGAKIYSGAVGANQVKLVIRNATFRAQNPNHTYTLNCLLSQYNTSSIVLEDCDFIGWGAINLSPKPISPPSTTDPPFGVTLIRCRRDTAASGQVLVDFSN